MSEPLAPPPSAVAWQMLLNGWGYNWYRRDNQMRADDLLIRSRACDSLHRAAASLRALDARHSRLYLPPPSRDAPDPDPVRMAQLRSIRAARDAIEAAETMLRGSEAPADDRIWQRHRDNTALLARLVEADTALIGAAQAVEATAADASGPPAPPDMQPVAAAVARLLAQLGDRRALLDGPAADDSVRPPFEV